MSENESFSLPSTEEDISASLVAQITLPCQTNQTPMPNNIEVSKVYNDVQKAVDYETTPEIIKYSNLDNTIDKPESIITNLAKNVSEEEKDVLMKDGESENSRSALPPPLPTKQMVHITNFPLGSDELSLLSNANYSDIKMDIDHINDSSLRTLSEIKTDSSNTEDMEVCEDAIEDTSSSNKRSSNASNFCNYSTQDEPVLSNTSHSLTNANAVLQDKNISGDNKSHKDLAPDELHNEIYHNQNSLKHEVNKGTIQKNDFTNSMIIPSYTKEHITIFGSTQVHSNYLGDNKESTNNSISHHLGDSNLNPTLSTTPMTKLRDDQSENIAGVETDDKDCVSKKDDHKKEDQEQHCVQTTRCQIPQNTTSTSQPTYTSSHKMVQSRPPNTLSSTSPNSVTAQSLFLSSPMPYSKPTCFSPTTPSPITNINRTHFSIEINNSIEKDNPRYNKVSFERGESTEELSDNESVELRPKQLHFNDSRVKATPERNPNLNEEQGKDTQSDTRQRTNSLNLIKSRFESMDCSDTASEKELYSASEQSSSEGSSSQPNSLSSDIVLMNVSRTPIEDIESGRKSSQGFSSNNKNTKVSQHDSSLIISNLSKKNKSSVMCRSTEGGRKKLSTVSLQDVDDKVKKVTLFGDRSDSTNEEDEELNSPLQRRNSIHNVPYVDVNDPDTRARMERYKEERRSKLRARYKVEDYRSEKQQPISNAKDIDNVSIPVNEPNVERMDTSVVSHSHKTSTHSNTEAKTSDNIVQEKMQPTPTLRKLPVGNKASNKQFDNNNRSHPQAKTTNVTHAKSNADRKWSIQTGVKQARVNHDSSCLPQKEKILTDSKSSKQVYRSSYPPNGSQADDDDVNVKERAAFWNSNQSSTNRNASNDKKTSMGTEKSKLQPKPAQRKISAPASQITCRQSSYDVGTGKEKRVKSHSMSSTTPSSVKKSQNRDDVLGVKQGAKNVFLRDSQNNGESCRQSPNIHHPAPSKIKNMTAFFEQNNQ